MRDEGKQSGIMKEFQIRLDKKLNEHEMSVVEYWKQQLDKMLLMKPDGIASLQLQIKRVSDMMKNRINILKKE